MNRIFYRILLTVCLFAAFQSVYARPAGGGMSLKDVCQLSGGNWSGSESGSWSCCWPDWGCYSCANNVCKMKCSTQRCKNANAIGKAAPGERKIEGLAPRGKKAPIAPKLSPKEKGPATSKRPPSEKTPKKEATRKGKKPDWAF